MLSTKILIALCAINITLLSIDGNWQGVAGWLCAMCANMTLLGLERRV